MSQIAQCAHLWLVLMMCQCNGAPVSQHRGNISTEVNTEGNSIVCINKLVSRGPVHITGASETIRFNLSDGVLGEVTAEVQELLCWVFEDHASSSRAVTIQHCHELEETTAAEESVTGTKRWVILKLWWIEWNTVDDDDDDVMIIIVIIIIIIISGLT